MVLDWHLNSMTTVKESLTAISHCSEKKASVSRYHTKWKQLENVRHPFQKGDDD